MVIAERRDKYPEGDTLAKVRVYELAKEFGVESKAVMAKLQEMGVFVRSASSTVEAPAARRLMDAFKSAASADPAESRRPPTAGTTRPTGQLTADQFRGHGQLAPGTFRPGIPGGHATGRLGDNYPHADLASVPESKPVPAGQKGRDRASGAVVAGSAGKVPPRIFISYRREETGWAAGWLFDRLASHFGRSQIFKDVDSIEPGDDFVEVITTAVGSCDVLLALIGSRWLTVTDQDGGRRLDSPGDFVRLEIEAALERGVRIIPILVDGALMPRADQLPESLAKLTRRQALKLSQDRFGSDLKRLLPALRRTITASE